MLTNFCPFFLTCLRTFDLFPNMGPYGSEHFKRLILQITFELLQIYLLKFPLNIPHKSPVSDI